MAKTIEDEVVCPKCFHFWYISFTKKMLKKQDNRIEGRCPMCGRQTIYVVQRVLYYVLEQED